MPTLIDSRIVLHPVTFNSGERIGRIDTYEIDGKRIEVRFWYDGAGRLVRVQ